VARSWQLRDRFLAIAVGALGRAMANLRSIEK
jgi:hypothetical protein